MFDFQGPAVSPPPRPFPHDPLTLARFRRVVDQHSAFVIRSLRRMGVPAADVEDAAQDVFVVAARRLADFAETHERSFLYGTAARVASERARAARRQRARLVGALDMPTARPIDPETFTELREARTVLDVAMKRMTPPIREVFALTEFEELPAKAIARSLDIPVGTVRSRLHAARSSLNRVTARLSPVGMPRSRLSAA